MPKKKGNDKGGNKKQEKKVFLLLNLKTNQKVVVNKEYIYQ